MSREVGALVPAYILHTRKYRDTSLIVELLTKSEGRVPVVMRGGRTPKKGAGVLQPFTPLLANWTGRGELKTLGKVDAGNVNQLSGANLLMGLYVNELMIRLLGKYELIPGVFDNYQAMILALVGESNPEPQLRQFEIRLLRQLGYGISFAQVANCSDQVLPDVHYRFVADEGFVPLISATEASYPGAHLLAIASNDFTDAPVLRSAKKILRSAYARLLGDRPLKSRELFRHYQSAIKGQGASV